MRAVLSLLLLLLLLVSAVQAQTPLRLGTLEDATVANPANQVLREAYARVGLQVQFEPLPLRRSAQMLKEGLLDGDFMRTPAFFEANPELLRVEPALHHVAFWVHRRPPCEKETRLEVLVLGRVAYLRGTALVEAQVPREALEATNTMGDALERVQVGRATASVLPLTPGMLTAVTRDFPQLCRDHLPVFSVDFFHALSPRQAALKPRLEAALRSMQRDGFTARVWAQSESKLEAWASQGRPRR